MADRCQAPHTPPAAPAPEARLGTAQPDPARGADGTRRHRRARPAGRGRPHRLLGEARFGGRRRRGSGRVPDHAARSRSGRHRQAVRRARDARLPAPGSGHPREHAGHSGCAGPRGRRRDPDAARGLVHAGPRPPGRRRTQPLLGAVRLPGSADHPHDRRPVHHDARPGRRRGPRGRRRGRGLRSRRRHHRRRAGRAGQARGRARGGWRDQRARLPAARGRGQRDDDVARRRRQHLRRQRAAPGRGDPWRRHDDQLAQLRHAQ